MVRYHTPDPYKGKSKIKRNGESQVVDQLLNCLLVYGWSEPQPKLKAWQKDPIFFLEQLHYLEGLYPKWAEKITRSAITAHNKSKEYYVQYSRGNPHYTENGKNGRNDRIKLENIMAQVSKITATLKDIKKYQCKDGTPLLVEDGRLTPAGKKYCDQFNNMGKLIAAGSELCTNKGRRGDRRTQVIRGVRGWLNNIK